MIKKGFSIAEMMIVMLMLSIVLAAATPIITKRVIASSNSGGDSSLPSGVIVIWKGSAATIPDGWQLCDGTNGTPDLRSRFVYGAGGDTNTKTSWANGWDNVNGHWPIGFTGGEEQHILTTAEMPNHTHILNAYIRSGNDNPPDYTNFGWGGDRWTISGPYSKQTDAKGESQPHNTLPRFYCLAYIMKL